MMGVATLLLAGCRAPASTSPPLRMPADRSSIWRPDPVELRVYPGTRFVQEGDRAFLQLGLELIDGLGDPVKAPGLLRAQLLTNPEETGRAGLRRAASGTTPTAPGMRLYDWGVRIATREEQEQHWDPVTRCYLLELGLDGFGVASRPCRVRAEFEPPEGATLAAEAVMRTLADETAP